MFKKGKRAEQILEAAKTTPFVGRETELQFLRQTLEKVIAAKKPKFVFIEGDFGVGKTTLVEHFLETTVTCW